MSQLPSWAFTVLAHPNVVTDNVAGLKYQWVGTPYLSNMFYKLLAGRPMYADENLAQDDRGHSYTAVGDDLGNPVDAVKYRAHCNQLWNTTEGGPCFFRPMRMSCPEDNPNASKIRADCAAGKNENGEIIVKDTECCKNATFDDKGVQRGGCPESPNCRFTVNFALPMEYGLSHKVDVDNELMPKGCGGLERPIQWKDAPIWGTPVLNCDPADLAPEGVHTKCIIDLFADDHEMWAKAFLDTFHKMQANGYSKLEDGPQESWLGYYSLEGQNMDVGNYENYVKEHAPLVFTDKNARPQKCGECHLYMDEVGRG